MSSCPLCGSLKTSNYSSDKTRSYQQCSVCELIFVPRTQLISLSDEKKRYDAHQNSEHEAGYRSYLSGIAELVVPGLSEGDVGLDFGCGSSTLLADLLTLQGFTTDSYDLFYHPHESIWEKKYDFIILSEVIEHLREPLKTMLALKNCLNPNGRIFVKTALAPESREKFDNWFYKRDETHVQFFNLKSFETLLELLKLKSLKTLSRDLFELHH